MSQLPTLTVNRSFMKAFLSSTPPCAALILNWLRTRSTVSFLGAWEVLHNTNFNVLKYEYIKNQTGEPTFVLSMSEWIKETNAIGIKSKMGRYGGTYAHKDIALNFCYWLDPAFQVFLIKAFQELMYREFNRQNLEWHISKLTDNVDEMRNLLDTIPGQNITRNRLNQASEEEN